MLNMAKKSLLVGVAGSLAATIGYAEYRIRTIESNYAAGLESAGKGFITLYPARYPWPHKGMGKAIDKCAARRGYQVFTQVCASCHSMDFLAFRHLIGVTHTEDQVKREAARYMIEDGPDPDGKMFMRPGKPIDYFPKPFPNKKAAMFANNGAYPPELSLICKARHYGADHIFSILIGYCEPPPGFDVPDGLYFNPYFPGMLIAMPPPLYFGAVQYRDGTRASLTQMARDVTTFLYWAGNYMREENEAMFFSVFPFLFIMCIASWVAYETRFASQVGKVKYYFLEMPKAVKEAKRLKGKPF